MFFVFNIYQFMCFFKHLKQIPESFQSLYKDQTETTSNDNSFSTNQNQQIQLDDKFPVFNLNLPPMNFSYSTSLLSLISIIQSNNKMIGNIQQKINQQENQIQIQSPEVTQNISSKISKDDILCKLFGDLPYAHDGNDFKYKLSLQHNIPNKFYKHRKYSISIKLIPLAIRVSKIVLNNNILNICIGVFDKDGNWVNENILGEPVFEGLTQVDLYQGKAEFPRLLFNQISSNLPKQKLNLAIYVKPGFDALGKSCGQSNYVSWKSIKPLILRNVTVLSKKRKSASYDLL